MGLGTRWILGHGNNQDNRSRHEIFNPNILSQNIVSEFLSRTFLKNFRFLDIFRECEKVGRALIL